VKAGWKAGFTLTTLFAVAALAQTSTNINLNLVIGNSSYTSSNGFLLAQTGSVAFLGNAALVMTGSFAPITNSGITGPLQMTFELAFNEVDTMAISFNSSDPNLLFNLPATVSGGMITGGTGAYAGATGSLDLTISAGTTSGSGRVTTQNGTIPLTLTNFHGYCCGALNRERGMCCNLQKAQGGRLNAIRNGNPTCDFQVATDRLKGAVLKRFLGHSRKPNKIHQVLLSATSLRPL